MKNRAQSFLNKYRDREWRWGIDGATLSGILLAADRQLIDEICDDTPFCISPYHLDGRTTEEYCQDLIEGRLFEDLVVEWFRARGRKVYRSGADKDNKIIRDKGSKIKSSMDLTEVLDDGSTIKLEVQISKQVRVTYHTKTYKGDRIVDGEGSLMFLILPVDCYFDVTADTIKNSKKIYNHAWQKWCYEFQPSNLISMED